MRPGLALIGAGFALVLGAAPAVAGTIRVTTRTDELTSGDHLCSLREAVTEASLPGLPSDCGSASRTGPTTILLGPHRYVLSIAPAHGSDDNQSGDLTITAIRTLTILGAGTGKTTISAAGLGDRVLDVVPGASAVLSQLSLTGGHAPAGAAGPAGGDAQPGSGSNGGNGAPGGDGQTGGGIQNDGVLTLNRVAVTGNRAGNGGPGGAGGLGGNGVTGTGGFPVGGTGGEGGAGGSGGGIYNTGNLTVIDSSISGNLAGTGGAGGAGGSSQFGGFAGGQGGNGGCCGDGGGIANAGSSARLTIIDSTISGNRAGGGGAGGSGGSRPPGAQSSYQYQGGNGGNGLGGSWGGGISDLSGALTASNSTIAGNAAGDGGGAGPGGLSNGCAGTDPCVPILPGSFGALGLGGDGGGLRVTGPSKALLVNLTIARNAVGSNTSHQAGQGGGIWEQGPPVTLENSVLASNGVGTNCATNGATVPQEFIDGGHNLSFGDTSCPSTFAAGDPKLGSLRDNGGPTFTLDLLSGSAARNRVPATGAHCPAADQRGVRRPTGPACDIGAYEVAPPVVVVGPVTGITRHTATVTEAVTINQLLARVYFQIGTTTGYGLQTAARPISGVGRVPVKASFTGLSPRTVYHYRLVATSADGTTRGTDHTFRTR